jgi:hypothetical protein
VPTIFRFRNTTFTIYTRNEHEPAHIHADHPDGVVAVILDETSRTGVYRDQKGDVGTKDVNWIVDAVTDQFELCIAAWEQYHR